MSGEVESGIGRLVNTIKNSDFINVEDLPNNYEEIAFMYLFLLIARMQLDDKSWLSRMFEEEQGYHDFPSIRIIQLQ